MEADKKARYVIGVDIGGTKIGTGIVSSEVEVIESTTLPTPATEDPLVVLDQIYRSIDETLNKSSLEISAIAGIGLVAPGPLNPDTGVIISAPNIPSFRHVPILKHTQDRYGVPTRIENDANAAGLAEALFGAGVGFNLILYVTVSTGIGTGIILDQKIYAGHNGVAAEGGHMSINFEGPLCACGLRGCIEAYASGTALARRARERLRDVTTESRILELSHGDIEMVTPHTIADAARQGDALAQELLQETARYLAIWLGSLVGLLDPDVIIIGGGLSAMGDLLFDPIRQGLPHYSINPFASQIPIIPARLKRNVGILGAAALHLRQAPMSDE